MGDIIFRPFGPQKEFLLDRTSRIKCLFAAKRSGKSEPAYIDTIQKCEEQPGYVDNGIDPYMVGIIGPTNNMMRTLVWPKFRAFAAPFEGDFNKTDGTMLWNSNNTIIHGVSAEKINRLEGKKLHHAHITEVFQMKEEVFLEVIARLSDTEGTLTIDGSLGPNLPNPKQHWVYKLFIKKQFAGARIWQWYTKDNPHFPAAELERLKSTLDPVTYRAMFEMDWDTVPTNAVYSNFSSDNLIKSYKYNPHWETYISIDWGYAHPAAVLFFQYDRDEDRVYLFDEIVESGLQIDQLWRKTLAKINQYRMRVNDWICDIAGDQTREQTAKSNVKHFRDKYGIYFKKRRTAVNFGIPIVRSYLKSSTGVVRFYIHEDNCPHTVDGFKRYHFKEKDGVIQNENPVKLEDDAMDSCRYYFTNMLDPNKNNDEPATSTFKVA